MLYTSLDLSFFDMEKVQKRQQNAALVIQSHYRSYLCRKSLVSYWLLLVTILMHISLLQYERLSSNYEAQFLQLTYTNTSDVQTLHTITRHLIFMCSMQMDVDKLVSAVTMTMLLYLVAMVMYNTYIDTTVSEMVTDEASGDPEF